MPLYEYQCDACHLRFEVIQRFSDPHIETCTACGRGPVRRLLSTPAIQFKGTGWYITDYAQKGKTNTESSSGDKSAEKGETKKGETKKGDAGDAKTATSGSSAASSKTESSSTSTATK